MADSVNPRFGYPGLRVSKTCAAAVLAGRLIEYTAAGTVQHAGAGSLLAIGVAMHDVPASAAHIGGPVVGQGNELTIVSGVIILVSFGAAAAEGNVLIAAANGTVTPAGVTPDARTVVGRAWEDSAGGGAMNLAWIGFAGLG